MRKTVVCLLVAAMFLLAAIPVSANDRQLRQQHTIEIEVECLETATDIIRGLNGYNLSASVFLYESGRHGAERWGMFERRVDYWAYSHVQEVLRGLGDVVNESQNALFLGAEIMDADARIAALTQEMERLAIMLAASENLNVLISIDARLSQVALDRNSVIGTRNVLAAQAANPVISIRLLEIPEGRPPVAPDRFGSRVTGTFMRSLRTTGAGLGHFLVFVTRVSIPVVIYAGLALLMIYGYVKYKRRQTNALAHQAGAQPPGAVIESFRAGNCGEDWTQPQFDDGFAKGADDTTAAPASADEEEGVK